MTDTLPYDKRGSYSILHNHLRAYEIGRLQKLADGDGNEAARARMQVANLNLQADAARRVRHDSDVTLVNGATSKLAELQVSQDSETEDEEDTPQERVGGTTQGLGENIRAGKEGAVVVVKEKVPSQKQKKDGRRKRAKATISKLAYITLTGYVPKPKGPEFAIYPI